MNTILFAVDWNFGKAYFWLRLAQYLRWPSSSLALHFGVNIGLHQDISGNFTFYKKNFSFKSISGWMKSVIWLSLSLCQSDSKVEKIIFWNLIFSNFSKSNLKITSLVCMQFSKFFLLYRNSIPPAPLLEEEAAEAVSVIMDPTDPEITMRVIDEARFLTINRGSSITDVADQEIQA